MTPNEQQAKIWQMARDRADRLHADEEEARVKKDRASAERAEDLSRAYHHAIKAYQRDVRDLAVDLVNGRMTDQDYGARLAAIEATHRARMAPLLATMRSGDTP
jgi:hypothetical protein